MVAFIVKDSIVVRIVYIIKEDIEHVLNSLVQKLFIKSSGLYGFHDFCIVDTAAGRHLKIKTSSNSLCTVSNCTPVSHYISVKTPFAAENVRKEFFVFCGINTVDLVVAAHHGFWLAFFNGNFKTAKVDFTESSFIHFGTNAHAEIFLVVAGKMLYGSSHIPFLYTADVGCCDFSGKVWVF